MIREAQERIYIFLDIDGVLNRQRDWVKLFTVHAACVHRFSDFCQSVGGRVILISTWKNGYVGKNNPANSDSIKALEQHFPIYGKIADGDRLEQIEQYVKRYDIRKYVIIDDDRTEYSRMNPHICFVDARSGFSAKDARTCRKILG